MKKIYTFCFLVFSILGICQNNGKITYGYIANGATIQAELVFNGNKSVYNSFIKRSKESVKVLTKENKDEDEKNEVNIAINPYNSIPEDLGLLTNLENNTIIENKYYPGNINGKTYDTLFIKDKARAIKWEILEESKTINALVCYKAIGSFRGRTYTVWFTLDIPVSFGPWKLNGLPGLILEASDSKKEYLFYVEKIELNKEPNPIQEEYFLNKNYINPEADFERFMQSMEKINEELTQKIRASLPRGTQSISSKKSKHVIQPESLIEFEFTDIP